MQKTLLKVAGGLLAVVVVWYGWGLFSGQRVRSPEELVRLALSDADQAQREEAALCLSRHPDKPVAELRRVFTESDSERVRVAAALGLGLVRDWDSVPRLLEAMQSPSVLLRSRAATAVNRIVGQDFGFRAQDPQPQRRKAIEVIKKNWPLCREIYQAKQGRTEE